MTIPPVLGTGPVDRARTGRVTLLAGSGPGGLATFARETDRLVRHLAGRGYRLRYGGGTRGLMGTIADAATRCGADIEGVVLAHLADALGERPGITTRVVPTEHARKCLLLSDVDAVVALPGGVGTADQFLEACTEMLRGRGRVPVAVYDVGGYWHGLRRLLACFVTHGFLGRDEFDAIPFVDSPEDLLAYVSAWCGARSHRSSPGPVVAADPAIA